MHTGRPVQPFSGRQSFCALAGLLAGMTIAPAPAAEPTPAPTATVIQKDGPVEVARSGAAVWDQAYTNQVLFPEDQLRTDEGGRAVLRMSDQTLVRVGEFSQIQMPADPRKRSSFTFLKGIFYFFHRDRPGDYEIRTRAVSAIVRGTEFSLQVLEADGTTTLSLFDGAVEMTNQFGRLLLSSGQEAIAEPGKPPALTPRLTFQEPKLVQWSLYYPGILYLPELGLSAEETNALRRSVAAYLGGDLIAAYTNWPAGYQAGSEAGKIYRAAVRLAVGQGGEA